MMIYDPEATSLNTERKEKVYDAIGTMMGAFVPKEKPADHVSSREPQQPRQANTQSW